jgi:beta-N-acetylhexosaminidase
MLSRDVKRMIGQMFVFGFEGRNPTPYVRDLVDKHNIAGLVYFSRNISEPGQLWELIRSLKAPGLLHAIDHEGGRVVRMGEPVTRFPAPRRVGDANNPELARRSGRFQATELAAIGINLCFAPVLDLATNPLNTVIRDRALSGDPAVASRIGAEIVRGIQETGVAACAKHFPGHGDTREDSHETLPSLRTPASTLRTREWLPFAAAIRAGVRTVMTAHVRFDELDPRHPASLSERIVRDILRKELRFDGVVVTDDLEMKAVTGTYDVDERTLLAIKAGADILLFCHTPEVQVAALETVYRAVEGRILSVDRIEQSFKRVQELKKSMASVKSANNRGELYAVLGCQAHRALAATLA